MKLEARQLVNSICYNEWRDEPKVTSDYELNYGPSVRDMSDIYIILGRWKKSGLGEAGCRHHMNDIFDRIDWSD